MTKLIQRQCCAHDVLLDGLLTGHEKTPGYYSYSIEIYVDDRQQWAVKFCNILSRIVILLLILLLIFLHFKESVSQVSCIRLFNFSAQELVGKSIQLQTRKNIIFVREPGFRSANVRTIYLDFAKSRVHINVVSGKNLVNQFS